jgi:hypothetical protein
MCHDLPVVGLYPALILVAHLMTDKTGANFAKDEVLPELFGPTKTVICPGIIVAGGAPADLPKRRLSLLITDLSV